MSLPQNHGRRFAFLALFLGFATVTAAQVAPPFAETFESEVACSPFGSGSSPGSCSLLSSFTNLGGDDLDWIADVGGTSSSNTGPSVDHTVKTATGFYLYTEASGPGNGHPNKVARVASPWLDFGGVHGPTVAFWYHMYGATMGTLHLDLQQQLNAGQDGTLSGSTFTSSSSWFDPAHVGTTLTISGSTSSDGVYTVTAINGPTSIEVTPMAVGGTMLGFTHTSELSDVMPPLTDDVDEWQRRMVGLGPVLLPAGNLSTCRVIFRGITGAGFHSDMAIDDFTYFPTTPVTPAAPYHEDFEGGMGAWQITPDSVGSVWQHGTSCVPVSPPFDSNLLHTGFDCSTFQGYQAGTYAIVEATFDLTSLAGQMDPHLALAIRSSMPTSFGSPTGDRVWIEIDTGSGFEILGYTQDLESVNWYDYYVNFVPDHAGWILTTGTASHPLTGAAGKVVTLRIIFVGSVGSGLTPAFEGAMVDEVRITTPTYPGTGEELIASTETNGGEETAVTVLQDVFPLVPGDSLVYRCSTPGGTFADTGQFIVVGTVLAGSMTLTAPFPGLQVMPQNALLIHGGVPGLPVQLPTTGHTIAFYYPGGAPGTRVVVQAIVGTNTASNGIFASTNAVEFVLQ